MTEPFELRVPDDHAAHDTTWMAALASRDPDLSPAERTRAQAALVSCGACADLFADLVAVTAAIPSSAIPTRPRDFTLTAADAARLRPRGLRRWLSGIGSARDGITFPLAMGLTTMGIAALLFATVPGVLSGMGGATAGAAPQALSPVGAPITGAGGAAPDASAAPAASAAASAAPGAAETLDASAYSAPPDMEAAGEGGVFSGDGGEDATGQRQDATEVAQQAAIGDDRTGRSALLVAAAALLIAGLGLFALRRTSRRLG